MSGQRLKIAWYGDDFTGASDTLAVAARAGLRSMLFLDVPDARRLAQAGPLDALGIAGSARTMAPAALQAELERVGGFFRELGAPVLHYKCCSTFDSSPTVGSIGAALSCLRGFVGADIAYVVGGQPDIGRYCCFSNLYAAAGADAEVYRLDRHPTMSRHPVTPMREADLRRHLQEQGLARVAGVHYPEYAQPSDSLDARVDGLRASLQGQGGAVLFDVADNADLATVGRQIWRAAGYGRALVAGPSTVVQALAAHWKASGMQPAEAAAAASDSAPDRAGRQTMAAPVFALAGSMSPVTARQVEQAASFHRLPLAAASLVADPAYLQVQAGSIAAALAAGQHVLAYVQQSGAGPDRGVATQDLARSTAELLGRVLRAAAARKSLRRIGVAGGDTSSLAVKALPIWGLSFLRPLSPGVALCRAHSDDPALDGLELMLKGGQMGPADIFQRLLGD
ncbi:four-carbon acid sugar kinase family protein [Candidimonas humi]|uniref:Four-carbon acid sugar kinase family protein n=1 Tax=Candidimonas humi TaxID=683355 RepID=A0ABV8NV80_9BURK|nr:four-carbon acid sugar kinase family protein [Candidimonas humi]MBV6303756.1 four-carbon acid sugar kinase family protein [Candidimonas humi]